MILSGHPSITLEQFLSDISEGILIWSNLILNLPKISKFYVNQKSNYTKLTLDYCAADASDKGYSDDNKG